LEHQRLWHEQLKQRQPLNLELLSPSQRQDMDLLLVWASGDAEQPLPAELRRGLQVAGCAADTGAIRHLLVDLGLWDLHCLPSLRDTRWELGFSAELEAECQRLLAAHGQPQAGDELRSDLIAVQEGARGGTCGLCLNRSAGACSSWRVLGPDRGTSCRQRQP
jgi:exoribonuclease-2